METLKVFFERQQIRQRIFTSSPGMAKIVSLEYDTARILFPDKDIYVTVFLVPNDNFLDSPRAFQDVVDHHVPMGILESTTFDDRANSRQPNNSWERGLHIPPGLTVEEACHALSLGLRALLINFQKLKTT